MDNGAKVSVKSTLKFRTSKSVCRIFGYIKDPLHRPNIPRFYASPVTPRILSHINEEIASSPPPPIVKIVDTFKQKLSGVCSRSRWQGESSSRRVQNVAC